MTHLVLAALLLLAAASAAEGQVFLASTPRPDFAIGPLFVSATVTPRHGPMIVTVSWGLVPARDRTAADIEQDLFILWPAEAVPDPSPDAADASLRAYVEARGFTVIGEGTVPLTARDRAKMGTREPDTPTGIRASFVSFVRQGAASRADTATFVKIPWSDRLADPQALMRIRIPVRDVVVPHDASWLEDLFWSQRYVASISYGDVGRLSLYPMYFEHRDRVVPLAPDFSLLLINFEEADHLKIDHILPASASRRPSRTRADTELVSINLVAAEGITPQTLRVQFSYFKGRIAWRPILISGLLLALGNVTGPLFVMLARRLTRVLRARVHVGRAGAGVAGRQNGVLLVHETLARIVPGETTYDDVIRLCGSEVEELEPLAAGGRRTLIYRGRRLRPHRRLRLGWLAAVDRWEVEQQEVQIELEGDRVSDVQARLRRYRLRDPETVT